RAGRPSRPARRRGSPTSTWSCAGGSPTRGWWCEATTWPASSRSPRAPPCAGRSR
ncbi:MAG: hypothetical protein AVDCRST_MAG11-1477, partial [uncultured Gemmatimonadaceae bacterium]